MPRPAARFRAAPTPGLPRALAALVLVALALLPWGVHAETLPPGADPAQNASTPVTPAAPPSDPAAAPPAGPLPLAKVPPALLPWVPWVLHGKEAAQCPLQAGAPRCLWPATLELELDAGGGRFRQTVRADAPLRLALPGDARRWPLDVKLDGKAAAVMATDDRPTLELGPGVHRVEGRFQWGALPEALPVPAETGVVTLTLDGATVPLPRRDAQGSVWLQGAPSAAEGDALDVVVHRRIEDDIPLRITTRIVLAVAGRSREILLGKALLDATQPLSLTSPIPARVEPDGRLRVQVRPGTHTLELVTRSEGPVQALARPVPGGPWREGDEVWVFQARPEHRVVDASAPRPIDPQQTTLMDAWRSLPAWAMAVGESFALVERKRGDSDPPPDRLELERTLWLDFDGHGATVSDRITGSLNRATRLEMAAPFTLERVSLDGRDQLVTHVGDVSRRGVEVRRGTLDTRAEARFSGDPARLPAVGWQHDFVRVNGTLNLPPGVRLLHVSGADEVPGTWLRHWTLLEIFLVLIMALATARLHGRAWGAVALVTLTLVFPEEDAPRWVWGAVLIAEALVRVAPAGALRVTLQVLRGITLVVLAIVAVPFLVMHIRAGLHPALDRGGLWGRSGDYEQETAAALAEEVSDSREGGTGSRNLLPSSPAPGSRRFGVKAQQLNVYEYDPAAVVQTGPGLPRWSWRSTALSWSGPVQQGQELRLWTTGPATNRALAFLRGFLLVALALRMLPIPWRRLRGGGGPPRGAEAAPPGGGGPTAAAAGALLAVSLLTTASRAQLPTAEQLGELEQRLLAPPACAPHCAAAHRMLLEAGTDRLRYRLAVDAAARVAVPLPGNASQWLPSVVTVDGKPATGMALLGGTLHVVLEPGSHLVVAEGPLPDRDTVQLALPLRPHRVEVTLVGWELDGVHADGVADQDLQLTRKRTEAAGTALEAGTLPPFVRVERTLKLALSWTTETRVVRLSPPGTAVVAAVPLLPGESVTTADVRVDGGKALVNLAPSATELVWQAVLEPRESLALAAPTGVPWVEVWRLELSPIWHATPSGIPAIHPGPSRGDALPEWRPWPGEQLTLAITRPAAVPGQSLTIDSSQTTLRPGVRSTDVSLRASLRASRGGEHVITLPPDAVLDTLRIDGVSQPLRQDGRRVTLPITPRPQELELEWREPRGVTTRFTSSEVDLGVPNVNARVALELGDARWVLFVGGPTLGPSVLFWSTFVVLVVLAGLLSRVRETPLGFGSWLLLGVGLSQVHVVAGAVVVAWVLALRWRATQRALTPVFGLVQLALAGWTLIAAGVLIAAIANGLLGSPEMQIEGNGSSAAALRWDVDRSAGALPQPWVISVPRLVYRGAMLAWALWLAIAVIRWLRWGWGAFSTGGLWPSRPAAPPMVMATAYGAPHAPETAPGAAVPDGTAAPSPDTPTEGEPPGGAGA